MLCKMSVMGRVDFGKNFQSYNFLLKTISAKFYSAKSNFVINTCNLIFKIKYRLCFMASSGRFPRAYPLISGSSMLHNFALRSTKKSPTLTWSEQLSKTERSACEAHEFGISWCAKNKSSLAIARSKFVPDSPFPASGSGFFWLRCRREFDLVFID